MRILPVLLAALAISAMCADAAAQASHPCATIRNAGDRLACYDKAFPPAGNAETLKDASEREADAKRDFGLAPWQRPGYDASAEPRVGRVERKIQHVERIETGQRIVTMEGGETWLLTESGGGGQLNDGDTVQIKKATFGTYMLVTSRKVELRARRIH